MKLANIFSTTKIDVSDDFNVVKSMSECIEGLPTLIVGYDYVKKHYPDFDITEIKLSDNLYWTVKRTERRDKFQEDLNWFVAQQYKNLVKDVMYVFVDPLQYTPKNLIKIVRKIYSFEKLVSYFNGDMIYLCGENLVFGIDLKLLRFVGFDTEKVKTKIKNISDVLTDEALIMGYKKRIAILDNQARLIPYIHSVENAPSHLLSTLKQA